MNRGSLRQLFEDVRPFLKEIVQNGFDEEPTVYDKIFNMGDMSSMFEWDQTISSLGIFPSVAEEADAGIDRIYPGYEKQYMAVKYRLGVPYSKEMFDDDQHGVITDLGAELGRSARATLETICANVFNNGFDGSYVGPDAKALFATDHPLIVGGDEDNTFSSQKDLDVTSLQDLITIMRTTKNSRGLPMRLDPEILLVHPSNEFIANEILGSPDRPDTANRATNVLSNKLRMISWPYLTDSDAWYLLVNPSRHRVKFKNRMSFYTDEEVDVIKEIITVLGGLRFDVGWTDWPGVAGSSGA